MYFILFFISWKRHVWCFCCIPTSHFWISFKGDQFSKTCFSNKSFFFAFVQKLLLTICKWSSACNVVFFLFIVILDILDSGIHSKVNFSSFKSRIKSWPWWHEKLFLICANINNAIFIFHQMLKAWGCIKSWWYRYWCWEKAKERHF